MLKDKFDKLKLMFGKKNKDIDGNVNEEVNSKKKIENLAVFLVILIITLVIINFIWNDNDDNITDNKQTNDSNKKLAGKDINDGNTTLDENISYDIKTELEEILSNISGVGKVKVMITYASTETTIPVFNEESTEENTEETDSEGGTRKVTQTDVKKEVIYEENDGSKTLITQKTTSPEIEGAIITAEGADNAEIKTNIIQAVEAVTGLPTHRIQVFKMSIN